MSDDKKKMKTSVKAKKTAAKTKVSTRKKSGTGKAKKSSTGAAAPSLLSGDLTLRRVAEVKKELLDLVAAGGDVTLRFKEVEDVDLSFIQILCSAHRSLVNNGKTMVIDGQLPESMMKLIDEAGLKVHIGCTFDSTVECPWLQKNI